MDMSCISLSVDCLNGLRTPFPSSLACIPLWKCIWWQAFPPFKEIESERVKYEDAKFHMSQTQNPDWKAGGGANSTEWKQSKTVELDPNDVNRVYPPGSRYTDIRIRPITTPSWSQGLYLVQLGLLVLFPQMASRRILPPLVIRRWWIMILLWL